MRRRPTSSTVSAAVLADPLDRTSLVLTWESGAGAEALPRRAASQAVARRSTCHPGRNVEGLGRRASRERQARRSTRRARAGRRRLGEDVAGSRRDRHAARRRTGRTRRSRPTTSSRTSARPAACRPWELTDAIDRGRSGSARPAAPHDRSPVSDHPLQILASLHGHYRRMLASTAPTCAVEKEAAELLGMRGSTFPAKKALDQSRRLGHDGIVQAVDAAGPGRRRPPGRACLARDCGRPRAGGAGGPAGQPEPARALTSPLRVTLGFARVLLSRLARRDLRRAAAFLWITPLAAALSSRLSAARPASAASSPPSSAAVERPLHARLQLGADGLVALVPLLVLAVALDLALDVGHEGSSGGRQTAVRG